MRLQSGKQYRSGFTLVEMVVATVIISMLLVALVGISRASAQQSKRAQALSQRFPSTSILEEQLTRDIRNADGYSTSDSGFTLFGAIATEPMSGRGTHQLARVTYAVQRTNGMGVLTRVEQGDEASHRRVVWFGAAGISMNAVGVLSEEVIDPRLAGGLSPMPTQIDVDLMSEDGEPILSKRVNHHRRVL